MKAFRIIAGMHWLVAAMFAGLVVYLVCNGFRGFVGEATIFAVWHALTGWRLLRQGWGARISSALLHGFFGFIHGLGIIGADESSWGARAFSVALIIYTFWALSVLLMPGRAAPENA